jgi:hypothetical protein
VYPYQKQQAALHLQAGPLDTFYLFNHIAFFIPKPFAMHFNHHTADQFSSCPIKRKV